MTRDILWGIGLVVLMFGVFIVQPMLNASTKVRETRSPQEAQLELYLECSRKSGCAGKESCIQARQLCKEITYPSL